MKADAKEFEWVRCPMCVGLGYTASPQRTNPPNKHEDADPPCDYCKGGGVVPRGEICGCGKPPVVEDDTGVIYCGNPECLKQLVAEADEDDEEFAEYVKQFGYHGQREY